jgi:hypothetical protein
MKELDAGARENMQDLDARAREMIQELEKEHTIAEERTCKS